MLEFKQKYLDCLCADLRNEIDLWEKCKSHLKSSKNCAESTPLYPQTTEEIAVGVLGFSANFGRETRLDVCECPKFAESTKGAPKSELKNQRDSMSFHSIYIGGGTPNTLNPSDYEQIFRILEPKITPHTEITMELNPNVSHIETLNAFKDLGVNRFSIGVQSFYADKLRLLERNHSPKIARDFIESALKCGVKTSIDLIYGTILDSPKRLCFELENALNLGVGHISCYALSIDKNSAFFRECKNPTRESSLCYELKEFLESQRFAQYEVSNFARDKSQKSRHNLGYWAYHDYIGVGLGAVGKITDFDLQGGLQVARIYKQCDFGAYLRNPCAIKRETLRPSDIRLEKIFLGFRSEVGVDSAIITNKERLNLLLQSDKIRAQNGKIYATNYFIADEMVLWMETGN